jgi:hypothetical protein
MDTVLRLKSSSSLAAIQIIEIQGGSLEDSFLDSGATTLPLAHFPACRLHRTL